MKSTTLLSIIGLFAFSSAFAQVNFVRPASDCAHNIVIPNGSNQKYYTSLNCKTIYVLPPIKNEIKIENITINQDNCGWYQEQQKNVLRNITESMKLFSEKVEFLNDMMGKIQTTPNFEEKLKLMKLLNLKMNEYEDDIAKLSDEEKEIKKSIQKSDFGSMTVKLNIELEKEVESFKQANPNSNLTFKPAPIKNAAIMYSDFQVDEIFLSLYKRASIPSLPIVQKGIVSDEKNEMLKPGIVGKLEFSGEQICIGKDAPEEDLNWWSVRYFYEIPVLDNGQIINEKNSSQFN